MAITGAYTRVALEHEPGEWVDVKQASYLDYQAAALAAEKADAELQEHSWVFLADRCIASWSYVEDKGPETIARLDVDTVNAIMPVVRGVRTEADLKNSSRGSTDPSTVTAPRRSNGS